MTIKCKVHVLIENGALINAQIVIAAAKGIVTSSDKSLLVENGGSIKITKNWAKSLLYRRNFLKRSGSTACKITKSKILMNLKKSF